MADTTIPETHKPCACGCGLLCAVVDAKGRPRRFAFRHRSGRTPDSDYLGKRFGLWDVLSKGEKRNYFLCKCDCGTVKEVNKCHLKIGRSTSCGCNKVNAIQAKRKAHPRPKRQPYGASNHPLYPAWRHVINRCYRPQEQNYYLYGGRGIRMCDHWRESFDAFVADMGLPPTASHSIDRIDPNGDYEPSNCRWATVREQARNKRNTCFLVFDGTRKSAAEWSEITGIELNTIYARKRRGWTDEDALTKPLDNRGTVFNGTKRIRSVPKHPAGGRFEEAEAA